MNKPFSLILLILFIFCFILETWNFWSSPTADSNVFYLRKGALGADVWHKMAKDLRNLLAISKVKSWITKSISKKRFSSCCYNTYLFICKVKIKKSVLMNVIYPALLFGFKYIWRDKIPSLLYPFTFLVGSGRFNWKVI